MMHYTRSKARSRDTAVRVELSTFLAGARSTDFPPSLAGGRIRSAAARALNVACFLLNLARDHFGLAFGFQARVADELAGGDFCFATGLAGGAGDAILCASFHNTFSLGVGDEAEACRRTDPGGYGSPARLILPSASLHWRTQSLCVAG